MSNKDEKMTLSEAASILKSKSASEQKSRAASLMGKKGGGIARSKKEQKSA